MLQPSEEDEFHITETSEKSNNKERCLFTSQPGKRWFNQPHWGGLSRLLETRKLNEWDGPPHVALMLLA